MRDEVRSGDGPGDPLGEDLGQPSYSRAAAAIRRDIVQGRLHDALAPLRDLHRRLEASVAERIIFDLGLVRSLGYYTGAVFQVYDPAYGMPIGQGGRYDELLQSFGRPLPAVGFALNVERLHVAASSERVRDATAHPRRP